MTLKGNYTKKHYKQLRLDFPDYTAAEQELDYQRYLRRQEQDVYVLRTSGHWNAFLPRQQYPVSISGEQGQELVDFIHDMKLEFIKNYNIKPRFTCIHNKGVEDHLIEQIEIHKLLSERSY